MSAGGRIVLLAGHGAATNIVYHALRREFGDVRAILEAPESRVALFRRRVGRLGLRRAVGQLAFILLARPVLQRMASGRIAAIRRDFGLDPGPIDAAVERVGSVNSEDARAALRAAAPDVVVVQGTRIIGRATLDAIGTPVINMHMGITPLYRGVHGGWWALAEGRPDLVGTTVHLVDRGIDTGAVIAQATFAVGPDDSFATYPDLHLAVGIPLLLEAVRAALGGSVATSAAPALPSVLRSHPTLFEYLAARRTRGAR